jgi:hypothetical protein
MSQQSTEEALMRKYLLGDLDQGQQEQVEEQLFCDDGFNDRLSAVQDELINEYAANMLPEREQELFEKNFVLDDERHKKLLFAHALELSLEKRTTLQPALLTLPRRPRQWLKDKLTFPRRRWAWAALAVVAVIGLAVFAPRVLRWSAPGGGVVPWESTHVSIERQMAELNMRTSKSAAGGPAAPELALQPLRLRQDGEMKRVVLSGEEELLRLRLALPPEKYESYRATTSVVGGGELFTVYNLRPEDGTNAGVIIVDILPKFLPTGDYQIELKGEAAGGLVVELARYSFRVINNVTRR